MNVFWSLVLGIVQGLTEFLPVSSSGHLVLLQKLLPNFFQPGVLFDVLLHFATLLSVVYFFRKRILSITLKYFVLIIIGSVPAVVIGFLFRHSLENMFTNDKFLSFEFLLTGVLNFAIDLPQKKHTELKAGNSFLIGISQAVAIIPAISRSGATIFTGVKLGIDRKKVAEYSFLLSIPAILGANILEILSYHSSFSQKLIIPYTAGFIAAFFVGFASIGVLMRFLEGRKFKYFGYYCIALGILTFFLA